MMFIKYSNVFKEQIDKEVKSLLELKAEYKKQTGKDWAPEGAAAAPAPAPIKPKVEKQAPPPKSTEDASLKKTTK
jgi:bifunctional glutamyl/prolyl-tRNA synthetase